MINRTECLTDLQSLLKRLEADLLERSESSEVPEVGERLRSEYERAKKAERTAENYEDWRSGAITQTAAAWVLSCVFVRFLEDNGLVDPPKIAGPNERLQRARDEHELYFRAHPKETDREYLLSVFDALAELPGTRDVFGPHNPLRELPGWLSGDAAGELLRFFQKIDANTGVLVHDFTDPDWDTRFLGDLYQDLSEAARKKYALLQTPEFVEEFILDRTLEPALDEFGLDAPPVLDKSGQPVTEAGFRMIDPACGSGHFLLGSFRRILDRWQKREPGTNVRELVQRTLASIHGVDVNPYAVAIARFRLLLEAMRACDLKRLADAPAFATHLACGDSLLHAPLRGGQQVFDFELTSDDLECEHAYQSEDLPALKRMLRSGQYHAVVANPPYITPKDKQLNDRYRKRFESCHRQYSLAVPFLERIFRLAVDGGFTGQITANSFMKREFGKKLIEAFFPKINLTHMIDTSGAYIPGHGTPTVILFGRRQAPVSQAVRAVMGIRGEPSTPDDPAKALVWSAIVEQIDQPGSESEFVSVNDSERERFHSHPWSIGGGGAAELKAYLDVNASSTLEERCETICSICLTREDEAYLVNIGVLKRRSIQSSHRVQSIQGEQIRDWRICEPGYSLYPYDSDREPVSEYEGAGIIRFLWERREFLWRRKEPNGDHRELNRTWWEWSRFLRHRLNPPLSIAMAFVATHNHFVLDRNATIFNRSAPVIKLPTDASDTDYFGLLGLLNSSVGCFWMKQVFHDKGSTVDSRGARQATVAFEGFREFGATGLLRFPLPVGTPVEIARRLDQLAVELDAATPMRAITAGWKSALEDEGETPASASLSKLLCQLQSRYEYIRGVMIFLQEELDWACYELYGLIDEDLTYSGDSFPLLFGERSFEILLAQSVVNGTVQSTTWFDRHGAKPLTSPPEHWPDDYTSLYHRRREIQQENRNVGLIEQPEYKRRWSTEPWESQLERALQEWLLARLESCFDFDGRMNDQGEPTSKLDISLISVARLADIARHDQEFNEVGVIFRDDPAFDVQRLVEELVDAESVPLLPILRYKPSGLRKRQEWEKTWELQRREDAIDARTRLPQDDPQHLTEDQARDLKQREIGDIPIPPKYKSSDFISTGGARYWALRGKLDVPKERWVSFPHCEGPDGTLVIAWAGYDHLQLARAISAYYVDIQERLGGRDDPRLVPLLAGLLELLPWLKQWHNAVDPEFGVPMGDYFEGFIHEEARNLPSPDGSTGWTLEEIKEWEPPKRKNRRTSRAER